MEVTWLSQQSDFRALTTGGTAPILPQIPEIILWEPGGLWEVGRFGTTVLLW